MASWHLAAEDNDTLTAPQHSSVTLGTFDKICPLFTRHVLEFWMSLILGREPALWKVDLRFRRTALAPNTAIMIMPGVFQLSPDQEGELVHICLSCITKESFSKSTVKDDPELAVICDFHVKHQLIYGRLYLHSESEPGLKQH